MSIEQIVEDNWPLGWIPSSSAQADFGQASQGLLRMDNLTLDERGSLRLINQPGIESAALGYVANSIFSAYINTLKLRYLYGTDGKVHRNYGADNSLIIYDLLIASGGVTLKAFFINALGHVIITAGTLQYKDRGDIQWPLQIPQPAPPALTNQASVVIDLNNLDGSGNYTNWASISSSAFNNTGTSISITGSATTQVAAWQTVYGTAIDTTNFGLTGEDTPGDTFGFLLEIVDPTQLTYLRVDFYCEDPTAGAVPDSFYAEQDFTTTGTIYSKANYFGPGQLTAVGFLRSDFFPQGNPMWSNIKAVKITVGCVVASDLSDFRAFTVANGAVTGANTYLCVELNDTGQFLQYSIASTQVSVNAALNYVQVDRSGTPCNSQCNNIRFYRNNVVLGQFVEVERQTGAYGFTPVSFIDSLSDDAALAAAAIDSSKVLNFFRAQLPTNIIGGIYFASRVIYLTTNSFIPSFQLDFGSYDSRFAYELVGTNSELCLFVTKLSVGTFIVATTLDFYQVSGDFTTISTANADGTTVITQNVNILPLGISDPAINSSFFEVEGNIFYMSSRGLRSMSNGTSTLLNTSIDLLFRNETRYGFPPVALLPNDLSLIGMVASGTRIYCGLPFTNGINAVLVSTYNPPLPEELRGSNYWRSMTMAAVCMCKELDGTVIYGDQAGFVGSLENAFTGNLTVDFLTQYNFGQHPNQTKTLGGMILYVNTGGATLNLVVNGLKEDGTVVTFNGTINSTGLKILAVDIHGSLVDCVAYQTQINGTTAIFELNYIIMTIVEEYPMLTFYALVPFSNLGKDTLKKLAKWGFVIDTLGNPVTVQATADNTLITTQIDQSPEPQGISTEFWYNSEDLAALDWQLEIIAPKGMHFFNFMKPDILQIYPPGRMLDQVGPLDLDREGIVFMMRLRVINEGATLHYEVLDNDAVVYTNDIATAVGVDTTYEEVLPKGVNTSVLRVIITAPTVFYRFSLEFKVRTLGKETEQRWVKV